MQVLFKLSVLFAMILALSPGSTAYFRLGFSSYRNSFKSHAFNGSVKQRSSLQIESEIYDITIKKFNLGSSAQLGKVLYDEQKIMSPELAERGKGGRFPTNSKFIQEILTSGQAFLSNNQVKLLELVLEWKLAMRNETKKVLKEVEHINNGVQESEKSTESAIVSETFQNNDPEWLIKFTPKHMHNHQNFSPRSNLGNGPNSSKHWLGLPPLGPPSFQGKGPIFKEIEPNLNRFEQKSDNASSPPFDETSKNIGQNVRDSSYKRKEKTDTKIVKAAESILLGGSNSNEVMIFDGHYVLYRSFYALPPLVSPNGDPIGAIVGLCNTINKLVLVPLLQKGYQMMKSENGSCRIMFAFDMDGGSHWRKQLYPDYKKSRKTAPSELHSQFHLAHLAVEAYGIPYFEESGFEADDTIATLTKEILREECSRITIVSGDKDLMQLVSDRVQLLDPMTMNRIGPEQVIEKWGVPPFKLGDVLALAGDASDNLPGVPNIGAKTAAKLIQEYGSLSCVLDAAYAGNSEGNNVETFGVRKMGASKRRDALIKHAEDARMTRKLVKLYDSVPLSNLMEVHKCCNLNVNGLVKFFKEHGLQELEIRTMKLIKKYSTT